MSTARKEAKEGKKSNFALHINDIRQERENKRLILSKRQRRAWLSMRTEFSSNIILKSRFKFQANVLSANVNGLKVCIRAVFKLLKLTSNPYVTKDVTTLFFLHRGSIFLKQLLTDQLKPCSMRYTNRIKKISKKYLDY